MTATSDIVLERVMRLHPKIIDLELSRVERLLNLVGNPERKLPPVVHVAGTNGKGSVIAYLRAMLEAAGKRVHVYTSPHLVRFHERIRIAGELIEEQALVDLIEECERANGGDPITFFEITTVAAFLAFSRVKADILLLETGLGGEFDATNVIAAPLATIIMPISFDHMQFLGDSLAKIATAKAGILKQGRPAIIAQQPPEAAAVIEQRAAALNAPLWRCGSEWTFEIGAAGFTYRDARGAIALPKPVLPGRHQFGNAAAAVAATRWLPDFGLTDDAIAAGLTSAVWPARMQRLTRGPLVDLLPARLGAVAGWRPQCRRRAGDRRHDRGLAAGRAQTRQPDLRHADQQGSARLPAPPGAGGGRPLGRRNPRRPFLDRGARCRRLRAPGRLAGRGP